MHLYRYMSSDGRSRALARDKLGASLPASVSRWDFLGPQDCEDTRLGVPREDIIQAVDRDGYFILPAR